MARFSKERIGMVRHGRHGEAWRGMAQSGLARQVRYGTGWIDTIWQGRIGKAWTGRERYGLARQSRIGL